MREMMTGSEVLQVQMAACFHCDKTFDLLPAPFCSCTTRERSFVCPGCGECACEASLRERSQFRTRVSLALVERLTHEKSEGVARLAALTPFSVSRPFAIVVDDDPLMLTVADHALRAMGYSTLVLSNPEEALAIAAAIVPDLLLTDALMPRMDGRELCRRLKSDLRTREIKIVVMSGLYRGTVYKNQAFKEFAVDGYVSKPLAPAVLREAVNGLLPGAAIRNSARRVFATASSVQA